MDVINFKGLSKNNNQFLEEKKNKYKIVSFNSINNQKNKVADFIKEKIQNDNNKKNLNRINNNINNNYNNINFHGFIIGNNPKINEQENNEILNTEPDAIIEDFLPMRRFERRFFDIKMQKEKYPMPITKKKNDDMINKFELKKNLNINPNKNINEIKFDPMMLTADNFYSKKNAFDMEKEEPIKKNEIKENLIPKKVEENINKENSPIKKVIHKFRNINESENMPKNFFIKGNFPQKIHQNKYIKNNFDTINKEEEEQISLNRRHNQIINRPIFKKSKKHNININDLIEEKKNKEKSRNLEIEPNKQNFEKDNLSERRIARSISHSNFNSEVTFPQNVSLLDNYNIFDSLLVILNNISYINNYLAKNYIKIYSYEKKTKYCLSIILYFINKYLWTRRPELKIKLNDLNFKYLDFLDCYLEMNCKNSNREIYFYNTDNLEAIINFIFSKINTEITAEYNRIDNFFNNLGDVQLNQFMKNFFKNNKSVISDNFTGFYQEEMTCLNCKNRTQRYGKIYIPYKQYSSFNYIYLDLENINNQYGNQNNGNYRRSVGFFDFVRNAFNQNNAMNFNINTNLDSCLNKEFNKYFQSGCYLCQFNTMNYIKKQFLSLPKILTIILNNKNANFTINSQINLSQFTIIKGNNNYYLIALLCKYTYNNRFITYCYNYKDGIWYSYTKREGTFYRNIKKATFLEPNAIPYLLIYQDIENMDFEYNEINLEIANNKKEYNFKFQNGIPPVNLYFGINATVKEVCKKIERYYKLKEVKLIINANQIKEGDLLSQVAKKNSIILVIPI